MKDAERIAELEAALRRSELLVEQLQARAALSAQQSTPERTDGWISVSERLPDVAQEVIVDSEFDGVTAGFLDSYGEWYSPNSDYKLTRVVAWQPLPAAPSLLATHRGQASGCHSECDALSAQQTAPQGLRIVLDGPPGPEAGRFVEVENAAGRSVNAGEWRERADGLWELVLHAAQGGE